MVKEWSLVFTLPELHMLLRLGLGAEQIVRAVWYPRSRKLTQHDAGRPVAAKMFGCHAPLMV